MSSSRVEIVMGLPVSVLVRGPVDPGIERAVDVVYAVLRRFDRIFSTYREDSEISLIRRGTLPEELASPIVREALGLCRSFSRETDGWFDAWLPGRPLDPSGLVKGWAVEQASAALRAFPQVDWLVNAGGDVVGSARTPWRIGVEDPRDRSRIRVTLPLTSGAVATSGTAARGAHLVDPHTGRPATSGVLSATVTGPSLAVADVHATAAFVQGPRALERIAAMPGYDAFLQLDDGRLLATPDLAGLVTGRVSDGRQVRQ